MTIVSIALAASTLVTPPAPDGAADGETSTEATPSNNVELALGADGNADGDLSTDETDFLIGWRGDRWVAFVGGVCWGENPREALFSTTNHWGRSVPTYRARAMESAHALMAIGDSEAMRTWYQELSQYPEFQDGSRNSTWRDTKTSLMMFFARTADIRVSTNCWFATADLLGKYNAVLRQCETDLAELSSFDSTNATADLVVQRLNAYRDEMNRALSYQRSVPLLSEAVTNVFPRYAMPIIPECWRAEVWSNVLHRAGLR